eukprot:350777-Chlamydomonas_euryale.AAC.1
MLRQNGACIQKARAAGLAPRSVRDVQAAACHARPQEAGNATGTHAGGEVQGPSRSLKKVVVQGRHGHTWWLRLVAAQARAHKVEAVLRHSVPLGRRKARRAARDGRRDVVEAGALQVVNLLGERIRAVKQPEQHYADRPDVRLVRKAAGVHLGRHERGRAGALHQALPLAETPRAPDVDRPDAAQRQVCGQVAARHSDHKVSRLDVAVHVAGVVEALDDAQHLIRDARERCLVQAPAPQRKRLQVAAPADLGDDVHVLGVLKEAQRAHNAVDALQLLQHAGLVRDPAERLFARPFAVHLGQCLDRSLQPAAQPRGPRWEERGGSSDAS